MRLHRTLGLLLMALLFSCFSYYANANPLIHIARAAALQAAKRFNNIPRGAQPIQTLKVPDKNTGQMLRQYNYINNQGKPISIRQDLPRNYPGAINGQGNQGHHFNAGPTGGKLGQHWNFGTFNRKG